MATHEPLLASLYAGSVTSRIATGPRATQSVLRFGDRIDADDLPVLQGERCASVGGVSVHANVAVPARDRRRLERLCRYGARPAIATERLSRLEDSRLLYRLEHRWRDGTTHVVFTPQELIEKLAALTPLPRFHLVRCHGVLGPSASDRDRIVPAGEGALPAQPASNPESLPHRRASMAIPQAQRPLRRRAPPRSKCSVRCWSAACSRLGRPSRLPAPAPPANPRCGSSRCRTKCPACNHYARES